MNKILVATSLSIFGLEAVALLVYLLAQYIALESIVILGTIGFVNIASLVMLIAGISE